MTTNEGANMTTTYDDLVAARDVDGYRRAGIPYREYLLAMRAAGLYDHVRVASAARRQASTSRRYAYNCERFLRVQARLGTEYLREAAAGAHGDVERRYAIELLGLDTVEQREEAWRGARRFLNATPDAGRPSDALRATVNAIRAGFAA